MKAGTKFTYPRVTCPYCKKLIAENWMVRHECTVERENELRENVKASHKEWLRERLDEDGYLD